MGTFYHLLGNNLIANISCFLVGWGGMVATLAFALVLTFLAFVHLTLIQIRETHVEPAHDQPGEPNASTSVERLR
ncbi:hypothetical protein I6F15_20105 [Bradyrhizobium sp. BRP14]|nr:hypothetical protein [Bradyrhizobium sp. BRP14]